MTSRKEAVLKSLSAAVIGFGTFSALNNYNDLTYCENQTKESQAQDITTVYTNADLYLERAQVNLTYQKIAVNAGGSTVTATYYPDGIDASKDLEIAVYRLNTLPEIAEQILTLAVTIPQSEEITIYESKPVDETSFQKEKQEIDAIREELKSMSDQDLAVIKDWENKTDQAFFKFLLSFGFTGLGFMYPAVYLAGKSVDREKIKF